MALPQLSGKNIPTSKAEGAPELTKMPKRGRPEVPKKLRLDKRVPIVVTEDEFNEIKKAADKDQQTVSAFGREHILKAARR